MLDFLDADFGGVNDPLQNHQRHRRAVADAAPLMEFNGGLEEGSGHANLLSAR
jgi:hypothetical protein